MAIMSDDHERPVPPSDDPENPRRRSFLQGAAGGAVGLVGLAGTGGMLYLNARSTDPSREQQAVAEAAPTTSIELKVNGRTVSLEVPDQRTLLLALREDLGLTGTKKGCNMGQCGACTVWMDGDPVYACFTLAKDAVGHEITTIEGLAKHGKLHPVQAGFIEKMGSQCGMCTTGMIMAGAGLLARNPSPTREEVRFALSGVLCRCGNYPHEVEGVLAGVGAGAARMTAPIPVKSGLLPPFPAAAASPQEHTVQAPESGKFKHLGKEGPALDGYDKATGRARYAGDYGFHPDDPFHKPLFAKVIRSPTPHAYVVAIDDSAAKKLKGYRGMITWEDVPKYKNDRHFLNRHARYCADAVAAIAADDEYTANEALKRIRVDWDRLPVYADPVQNLKSDNTVIHSGGPVSTTNGPQPASTLTVHHTHGDLKQGFDAADKMIKGRYITGRQCHVPIEPHCCTAVWKGDQLNVWDSQQSIFMAQKVIAKVLDIKPQQVRVICENVGGGFGGKCTDSIGKTLYQAIAATLAKKTGKPVRLEYTLDELTYAEDTRDYFTFDIQGGVKHDGTITAFDCEAILDNGGYASSGPPVASTAIELFTETIEAPAWRYKVQSVYTNAPVGGEMRGFGGPAAAYAIGVHLDELAEAAGMDPIDFLKKNIKRTGAKWTQEGVPGKAGPMRPNACLDAGAKAIGWHRRRPPATKHGRIRHGLGMYGSTQHTGREGSDGLIWIDPAGKIHVPIGSGNMGQSAHTGIAAIVAQALDVPADDLDITWGDTDEAAWVFVTDASRSCHCDGKAIYNAAQDLVNQLAGQVAAEQELPVDQFKIRNGRIEGPGGHARDFRSVAASAKPRTDFKPYYNPELDQNPKLSETTGKLDKHPSMDVKWQTLKLAKRLQAKGGVIGLGHYIRNPATAAWGAAFAEVEVDMETGQVRVLKLVDVHDIGRLLYATGAQGQSYGGAIMGLGYAMTEALIPDPNTGVPVNPEYLGLSPMSSLDYPEIVPIFIETPAPSGPFGAKGLGENPMLGSAPAVANAVYNATGVRVREIPLTWERVHAALRRAKRLMA
jgi:CO/xanthine dehydrogenase Mo-binding subunit/aerobic-type carbon monoxide dehydrogenase small subunit (CoxS/CutS family)